MLMEPFTTVSSPTVVLLDPDIDTDVITPMKRMMERGDRPLHHYAFEALRYVDGDGDRAEPDPRFCLNRPGADGAAIMLTGPNFGCGSSRESAAAVLAELGIRCLIGTSFGDIFFNNCFQQGMLAIVVDRQALDRLVAVTGGLSVDLERQEIATPDGSRIAFECNPLRRRSLLAGLDDIGLTLTHRAAIDAFRAADRKRRPWIHLL
jgi:3-isopropylmalate/(R)-2-methylmalate dehydratase small subunit